MVKRGGRGKWFVSLREGKPSIMDGGFEDDKGVSA
jgi:hypothetical protein